MKSRLLIRALCVGAALLVPVGGLTMLGVGTAGATTVKAQITGQITLGTVGSILVGPLLCTHVPVPGTKQCSLAGQWVIKKGTTTTNVKALLTATLLITVSSAGKITAGTIKKGWGATIKTTGGVAGNNCTLSTGPKIVFTVSSTGGKLTITTKSLAGVVVGGATCAAATKTLITGDITGKKLTGTIGVGTL